MSNALDEKVKLAVFDFDGTCISGSSPTRLVLYLLKHRMLNLGVGFGIGIWGLLYKFHLPQNESWVRSMVFRSFRGMSVQDVDRFMEHYYKECVKPLWRPLALATMRELHEAGYKILLISATFEPIALCAMEDAPIDLQASTQMVVGDDGCYSCEVLGEPIEGEEKICALHRLANAEYGAGNWEVVYSFGDHYSDVPILEVAQRPNAVTPDSTLQRHAMECGWTIRNWETPEEIAERERQQERAERKRERASRCEKMKAERKDRRDAASNAASRSRDRGKRRGR